MLRNVKIRTKSITIFCSIITCTILIVSYVGFFIAKKSIKNIRLETLESIADLKVDAIDKFFKEKIANIITSQDYYNIKYNLPILIQLKNDKTNPTYIQAKYMLDDQLKTFQKIYEYLNVMLTDKDGNIVYVSNESHIGSDLGRNVYSNYDKSISFKEVTKEICISQVFVNTIEGNDLEMMLMTSIYGSNKTVIGVIVLEVNMKPIYELLQNTAGLGNTGETLIVSNNKGNGEILNLLRHDQDSALKRIVTFGDINKYSVQEVLKGKEGSGLSVDYRGKDIIAAWRYIALLDWGLIAKVDTSEAFAPITKVKHGIFFVAVIILGVAVIFAIIISKSITDPIKKLSNITHKINSGNLEIRAEIESKDEIGMLAKSFNTMTNRLVDAKIEEEQRSKQLEQFNAKLELLLSSIPSIIIELSNDYKVLRLNHFAECNFGICEFNVVNRLFCECNIEWDWDNILNAISLCKETKNATWIDNFKYKKIDKKEGYLDITINPLIDSTGNQSGILILMSDITERKDMEQQLLRSQKLESIGHLAAGIAHEINTPTQYITDNTSFLKNAFSDINKLLKKYSQLYEMGKSGSVTSELIAEIGVIAGNVDIDYLVEEIPNAINQSLEGLDRVKKIVYAMKSFSHPDNEYKNLVDINEAIKNTIDVARNEWKYVARVKTDFDSSLTSVPCFPGEFNQVILNLIVNAAHAICEVSDNGSEAKGTISISTRCDGEWAEIRVSDTGTGIPEHIRSMIFDPFFTTKEVGKGTGQGLPLIHSTVVGKHNGTITLDTELGKGTTFIIRLPLCSSSSEILTSETV